MTGTRRLVLAVGVVVAAAVLAFVSDAETVLGLATLAAAGAVLATHGLGRRLVAVLVLGLGGLTAASGADVAAYVAGLLDLLAAAALLWKASQLPALGGRYEAPGEERAKVGAHGLWDALDRGEDPT